MITKLRISYLCVGANLLSAAVWLYLDETSYAIFNCEVVLALCWLYQDLWRQADRARDHQQ